MSAIDEYLLDEMRMRRKTYLAQCQERNAILADIEMQSKLGYGSNTERTPSTQGKVIVRKRSIKEPYNSFDAKLWNRRERYNSSSTRMYEFRVLNAANQYNQSNTPGKVHMPKDMEAYEIKCYWKFEAIDREHAFNDSLKKKE